MRGTLSNYPTFNAMPPVSLPVRRRDFPSVPTTAVTRLRNIERLGETATSIAGSNWSVIRHNSGLIVSSTAIMRASNGVV